MNVNKYIILNKKTNLKKVLSIIKELNMHQSLKNRRTTIWENADMQISIDSSIIRILIYSNTDVKHYSKIFLYR